MVQTLPARRPPRQREYAPKPLDPGQPISWTLEIHGYWTEPPSPVNVYGQRERGEWVDAQEIARTGTVWSAGPTASSRWVIPDDAPDGAVLVFLPGKRDREWGRGPREDASRPPGWQRDAVRRADHVRAMGRVFATVESERDEYPAAWNGYRKSVRRDYLWHCDPDCPEAAGRERGDDRWPEYGVASVVDILTGRANPPSSPPFCRPCIYLEAAASEQAAS